MDDLISRADAIEAIEIVDWYHQNQNKDMVSGANDDEHQAWYKAQDIYKALEAVPSADRPRGEWTLLTEERPVDNYEIIATVYWPGYGDSTIAVGHIDRFDNWHLYSPTEGELIKGFEVIAWKTLPEPYCGADMRGEDE